MQSVTQIEFQQSIRLSGSCSSEFHSPDEKTNRKSSRRGLSTTSLATNAGRDQKCDRHVTAARDQLFVVTRKFMRLLRELVSK